MVTSSHSDPWLSSRYGGRFNAHLHAMGVVLIEYNLLEQVFRQKAGAYLGCALEVTAFVYDALALESVIRITKTSIELSELPDRVKQREFAFFDALYKCAVNRNHVAHSFLKPGEPSDLTCVVLEKWKKKTHGQVNWFGGSLEDLRRTADEINQTAFFGRAMTYYSWSRHSDCFPVLARSPFMSDATPSELPEIPPEPTLLREQDLPVPKVSAPQPKSSPR